MDYSRNTVANKHQRGPPGGHNPSGRALVGCSLLSPPLVPLFWYISHFDLEKIRGGLSGRSATVSRRNLGRSTFALRRSWPGELPSRRGKSSSSSSPTSLPSLGGHLHQHLQQHHLFSNPNLSLVFNLCTETSDWYLWVTSSVDCIL